MAGKQRELPSWMATEERVKEKKTLSLNRIISGKRTRSKRIGRTAFYCMNEKELVEAAIIYLTDVTGENHETAQDDQKVAYVPVVPAKVRDMVAGGAVNTQHNSAEEKRRRLSEPDVVESSDSDAQDRTYVSETDMDITEEQTLQYTTNNNTNQGSGGQSSGSGHGHDGGCGPVVTGQDTEEAEDQSKSRSTTADDDALQLVREIFFT